MAGLLQDVRFAFRQLRKNPGFTLTAIAMLAVAICANSTVFSWINGIMLHPIPGARATGELVSVMRGERNTSPSPPLSYLDYRDMREQNRTLVGMLAYNHDWITLTHAGAEPDRIYIANVSANFFDLLGVKPVAGALLSAGRRDAAGCGSLRCAELFVVADAFCGRSGRSSANPLR